MLVTCDFVMKVNDQNVDFRLQSFPHRLKKFNELLMNIFGSNETYRAFGDFRPLEEQNNPSFYIHCIEKST